MDKFLEFVVDKVFSAGTFLLILAGAFLFFISSIAEQGEIARKNTQKITEACYSQGMVVVDTDAGERCADPRTLVKVK
jgi:hypothetical protein